jgi:hypothetical protein
MQTCTVVVLSELYGMPSMVQKSIGKPAALMLPPLCVARGFNYPTPNYPT